MGLPAWVPAEVGLPYCNRLFYLERGLKDLPAQERALKRRGLEIPVWEGFWKWAVTVNAAGAWASAVIYSIVETAKANGLNVFQYLYLVLLYMPDYQNEPAGIGQLLPGVILSKNIVPAFLCGILYEKKISCFAC